MATLRNLISATFGLLLFTQCNKKEKSNDIESVAPTSVVKQVVNSLNGKWKYNNTIWYSSELTLHDNGTFTFHDQGCNGQKFSQGQWTNSNGSVLLTSFDRFKPKEQVETIRIAKAIELQKAKRKLKKGEVEYLFVEFKDIPAPVFPRPHDTVQVYLNKIKLQLRNDTLYCVGSNTLLEEAKFHRMKNN